MRSLVIVVVLLALPLAACGGGYSTTTTAAATTAAAAATATGTASAGNTLTGTVGPGSTISLQQDGTAVTTLPAGTYSFAVSDEAATHNFALVAPDGTVTVLTTVPETGSTTTTIDLTAGTWTYECEPHIRSMSGSFTVT